MTAAPGRAWGSLSPTLRLRPRPGRGTGTGSRFPRFYLQRSVYLSDRHRVANESCCELNLVRVSCISRSNRREVGEHVPRGPGSRSARAARGSRRRLPRGRPAAKPASLTPPGHLAGRGARGRGAAPGELRVRTHLLLKELPPQLGVRGRQRPPEVPVPLSHHVPPPAGLDPGMRASDRDSGRGTSPAVNTRPRA